MLSSQLPDEFKLVAHPVGKSHLFMIKVVPIDRLFPTLSMPACFLWMESTFSIVLQRKTL